jgi:pyruvate formate lyase activating enzyme
VGCGLGAPLEFLDYLTAHEIPTTLRQVIIPTVNDTEEQVAELGRIASAHPNVDKIELLPFRKICQVKYDDMGMTFPFAHIPEPSKEQMTRLEQVLGEIYNRS